MKLFLFIITLMAHCFIYPLIEAKADPLRLLGSVSSGRYANIANTAPSSTLGVLKVRNAIHQSNTEFIAKRRKHDISHVTTPSGNKVIESAVWDLLNSDSSSRGTFTVSRYKNSNGTYSIKSRVSLLDEGYEIFSSKRSRIRSTGVDHEKLPGCGQTDKLSVHLKTSFDQTPKIVAKDNTTIDIMIIYSPQAVTANFADDTALAAHAAGLIASINAAWARSGVTATARLVYAGRTTTNESGSLETDLDRMQLENDGFFDDILSLRTTYGADIVSLIDSNSDSQACGIGYITRPQVDPTYYAQLGFNVVGFDCISSYSFEHEVGHNLGCAHDLDNAGDPTSRAYSYSVGWRFNAGNPSTQYRTIMSYAPGIRIPYLSNPDISYLSSATGTSSANNALTINNTAPYVASFSTAVSNGAPTSTPVPTPTATNTPDPKIPTYLSSYTFTQNTAKKCVFKAQVLNSDRKPLSKILVQPLKYQTNKAVGARVRSAKDGKFSLTTTLLKKQKVLVSLPSYGLVSGPYTCK